MTQYVIEFSHSPSECVDAFNEIEEQRAEDMLGEIYWGCMTGDHVGRIVVDAESEEEARMMVPESIRSEVNIRESDLVSPALANAIDPEAKNPMSSEPDAS